MQKYLSLTRIVYDPLVVLFSKKTWDRLNADEQKVLSEAAREATDFQRKLNRERQVAFVKVAPSKGMLVNNLSEAEKWLKTQKWYAYDNNLPLIRRFWRESFKKRP